MLREYLRPSSQHISSSYNNLLGTKTGKDQKKEFVKRRLECLFVFWGGNSIGEAVVERSRRHVCLKTNTSPISPSKHPKRSVRAYKDMRIMNNVQISVNVFHLGATATVPSSSWMVNCPFYAFRFWHRLSRPHRDPSVLSHQRRCRHHQPLHPTWGGGEFYTKEASCMMRDEPCISFPGDM